ncbi:dTMP kinase [Vibrio marisflavi]|uniref:Thymidylate kinase n=1 Tax=Vibrio marisflavi CECT 7928 TaxID=634439 RepID=A0ABN8E517_9VIBR|nr:dTMP kinase [Vibrio marisflavi]CAH0539252.1 Thymidylate kinase [Vibrio marisflavi CECT 7928]
MNKAKFIVVEGLEGAGKSTAMKAIVDVLNERGITQVKTTREPGGTVLAEKMRELTKLELEDEPLQDMSELMLMYAARVQLVETVIKPTLDSNTWVIGDRHDMSSQAYQGGGRQISSELIQSLKHTALGDFKPDFTLYLDIEPSIGLARARGRGELDRIEKMDLSFFQRTRDKYLELAKSDERVSVIDAGQEIQNVSKDITSALTQWLDELKS